MNNPNLKAFGTGATKMTATIRQRLNSTARSSADTITGTQILTDDGLISYRADHILTHRATLADREVGGFGGLGERGALAMSLRQPRNLRLIDAMVDGAAGRRRGVYIDPVAGDVAVEVRPHVTICSATGTTGPTAAMVYQARQSKADVDAGFQPFVVDIRTLTALDAINLDDPSYAAAMVVGGIDAFDYLRNRGFPDLGQGEDELRLEGLLVLVH